VRGTPIDVEYRLHEMAGVAAELARTRAEIGQLALSVREGLASSYDVTRHCYLTETHLPLLVGQVANIGAAIAAADRAGQRRGVGPARGPATGAQARSIRGRWQYRAECGDLPVVDREQEQWTVRGRSTRGTRGRVGP